MASEEGTAKAANPTVGWRERAENQWMKMKVNAEEHPYVWASYIVVYGGLGTYLTYRWWKLRRTESRVRILQDRLRKLVEAEDSASSSAANAALSSKPPPPPPSPTTTS